MAWCRRIWNACAVAGTSALIENTRHRCARPVALLARHVLGRLTLGMENELTAGLLIGVLAVVLFALMIL